MFTVSTCVRWLRYGTGFGLSLVVLLGVSGLPGLLARADDRDREIAQIEKKLAELKKKLAELKKTTSPKARRPLQLQDAVSWPSLGSTVLSRDGQWFAYRLTQGKDRGETVVRQVRGDKEYRFPDGGAGAMTFSHDSRWLAFTSTPGRARRGAAKKGPPAAPPAGAKVVLLNLTSGEKVEYAGASRFAFAGEASNVLAVHKSSAQPPARGGDLILRDLAGGKELTLGNVAEFSFDRKGRFLALVIDAQGQFGNGVQLRNMKTAALQQLDSGKASYQGLNWTENGEALSVLKGVEDKAFKDKLYSLVAFTDLSAATPPQIVYDPAKDPAFPRGMTIAPAPTPYFADDQGALFFGIREPKKAEPPAKTPADKGKTVAAMGKQLAEAKADAEKTKAEEEKPDLVLWHWRDERLQSQQQKEATSDSSFSYLCTYRIKEKKFLRLADDTLRSPRVAPGQRWAIARDDRATRRSQTLDGQSAHDLYVIDLHTGERHLALKNNRDVYSASPDGSRFLYHDDGHFHVCDMATRKTRCICKDAQTCFIDTEHDYNIAKQPTRVLGWSKDSSAVLVSDNWDVWLLSVTGERPAVNLTGNGKKDARRYRSRLPLDPEEKGIDLSAPQYFSVFCEWTKKSGFVRIEPGKPPAVLCFCDAEHPSLMKARDADVLVYTRETIGEYPDCYATDSSFKTSRKLTNVVPQQDQFLWSSGSILVNYESTKGDRLQGALLLPANYEKGKKYPTVVHIYERLSGTKNHYLTPMTWESFSPAMYTSNGYAVFMPDIKYRLNDPGMSAVWCVLPALEAAIATGIVDRERVGLQGHSWGGFQTAFLITQTTRFKAAVAGAPLTNLVSMYSSVYGRTGTANQPIFESSQGRFTAGYCDLLDAYLRNSPVIHAKNVKTPLLLLHNDKDGAVDFNQGIEYFNTLRRLNKPVVLLQYKGESHGLVKPANQQDYCMRMREFFDHHLLGKPAPAWLESGVPHLKLDEHLKERAAELGAGKP
jgi:dipeptidyl aminopeptidase/acylaminoacyl peptidase